jgi:hypothetical protein
MKNHQVLAIGYDDFGDGRGVLHLYDSNRPGFESKTVVDFNGDELVVLQEDAPSSNRGPLKGFFISNYNLSTPPDGSFLS